MRVLVLGSGVVGVTSAWYLLEGGPPGHRARPPAGAGDGDQLRQCRPGLARLFRALGRARHSHQGDEVAADAAPPFVLWPALDHGLYRWIGQMLANCNDAALRHQQGPHGAAGRIQPRRAARPARRDRHRLRPAHPGHAAAVPHPEAARRVGRRHRGARSLRRALQGAGPGRLHRAPSRRSARCPASSSAACACRATRPATATCLHPAAGRAWPRRGASSSATA